MKILFQYWYLWGILLLAIGFLVAKNWGKIVGKKDVSASLKLLRSCKKICNDNYTTAVNNCNQYTGTVKQHCLQVAGVEWDRCLGKCK